MKIMEDFADIAARLNQIEQEKLAVVMSAPVDEELYPVNDQHKTPNGIMFDDSGDTAPCEYIGCWGAMRLVSIDLARDFKI